MGRTGKLSRGKASSGKSAQPKSKRVEPNSFDDLSHQSRPAQRRQNIPLDIGKGFAGDRGPRDQDHVHWLGEIVLMQAEDFPQQPPGAAACGGVANPAPRHDSEARRRARVQTPPVCDHASHHLSMAFPSNPGEVTTLLDVPGAAELEGLGRGSGHCKLDWRQAFAPHTAAIAQDAAAALFPFARQEPMLPLASNLRRLILSFHKMQSDSSPRVTRDF
jgi:hypothetical protein